MQPLKSHKTCGGQTSFWVHDAPSTKTSMGFATFVPEKRPIKEAIIWLSGLTCTEENFVAKSGIQQLLAASDIMVIAPDTSPRGLHLPGEHDAYDFGSGAGFYVDATTPGYREHYRMFSYVTQDLVEVLRRHFGVTRISLMGHSMGGHGALVMGLRYPQLFHRITAFAPIVNPSQVPWGLKAFSGYLGGDSWAPYDACELLRSGHKHPQVISLYQGTNDPFLKKELQPEVFAQVAQSVGQPFHLTWCEGYDHSYYFISSFLEDALKGYETLSR